MYQLLGAYSKENPAIRIVLRQANADKKEFYRFEDFTVQRVGEAASEQNYIPLECRGGIYAILPDRHPLASRPQLTLSDLEKQKFVFLRDHADSGMESVYDICVRAGFIPDVSMIVETLVSIRETALVSAASSTSTKNTIPVTVPRPILANTLGRVINIRDGPA